jgi:iron-sulfur cluster assembly protein
LTSLLDKEGKTGAMLRVWVAGLGCSGFSYGMGIEEKAPEEGDSIFESNGLKVVMDRDSVRFMDGSRIDFLEDPESGGFSVENPNPVPPSNCNCGGECSSGVGAAGAGTSEPGAPSSTL